MGHPSEELKIATAKSKGIELKSKGEAKWLASRNFEKYDVYRMINVQREKITETRKVTFVGKMFGEIYDLENYFAYQVLFV